MLIVSVRAFGTGHRALPLGLSEQVPYALHTRRDFVLRRWSAEWQRTQAWSQGVVEALR